MAGKDAVEDRNSLWGRRDFLRLSIQAASTLGLGQAFVAPPCVAGTADAGLIEDGAGAVVTADTPWILSGKKPEALQRALADVRRDWYKVFGHTPVVLTEPPEGWRGAVVYFGMSVPGLSAPQGRESFSLGVHTIDGGPRAVAALGSDLRGAIYAAYAFSEKVLGVDPWWYWADKEPVPRTSIRVGGHAMQHDGPPTFRFRGWFINDEDLLAGFRPDPLRENVFSLEMLDLVCETLLRLRGNMIVPATFSFPDERCNELVARRGLALGMHHANVVGLNVNRWPPEVPFSYSQHPEIMERYWQECISTLKDKEVVWSVGYRGKGDQPFWEVEPGFETSEARGGLITRAIAKQVELIRKVQPEAPITTNMWNEGVELYQSGLIEIPPGVTLVWPDNGSGLMRDGGTPQAGSGMYYHTMMLNGLANQLSEFVPPERICREIGRYARADATEFFLVNVSDVRPALLSTECAMRIVWDAEPYLSAPDAENEKQFLLDWSARQFGLEVAGEVAALYGTYFSIPSHQPVVILVGEGADETLAFQKEYLRDGFSAAPQGDNAPYAYLAALSDRALPLIGEGNRLTDAVLKDAASDFEFAATNRRYFSPLLANAEALASKIPAGRRGFFRAHLLTAIAINLYSNEMLEHYCRALRSLGDGARAEAVRHLEGALAATHALFAALRPAERGQWAGWYIGECLVGLEHGRDLIRSSLAAIHGEPPPPVRAPHGYDQLYQYQERFKSNFPLLYGPKPATLAS